MVVRALSGRPVRRLTDRPARADRAHRSRQRRGANRALVRDDDDQMGPRQLGVRPSRVRATRRGVLPVMVVPTGVRIALRAGPVRLSAAPFPLVPPAGAGTQVNLRGTLHAGSGFYVDILQAPGAGGFALRLGGVLGLAVTSVDPRLDVIRIR